MNATEAIEQREAAIEKLRDLIKDIRVAMLTTVDPEDGTLRSRPMYVQDTAFDGTLWFFTRAGSPKVDEIEEEHDVNVSFAEPDDDRYVSVSGKAQLVRDREKVEALWNPVLKAWFPKGTDDPDLALLRVRVDKAEYWTSTSSLVTVLTGFVKAVTTGKRQQEAPLSEHEKLQM